MNELEKPIISNVTAKTSVSKEIKSLLISQIEKSCWLSVEHMINNGVKNFVKLDQEKCYQG